MNLRSFVILPKIICKNVCESAHTQVLLSVEEISCSQQILRGILDQKWREGREEEVLYLVS